MQSLTFIIFTVYKKIATLKFLPLMQVKDTRPEGQPNSNTDHYYIDSIFMQVKTIPQVEDQDQVSERCRNPGNIPGAVNE